MNTKIKTWALALSLSGLITGCGSDDETNIRVSDLERLDTSADRLVKLGAEPATTLVRNGLMLPFITRQNSCNNCEFAAVAEDAATAGAEGDFSTTTTQEVGVDESDRVKYDGQHIYLASNQYELGIWFDEVVADSESSGQGAYVRVLTRQQDDSLVESAIVQLPDSATNIEELYVDNGKMAAIYPVYETPESANGTGSGGADIAIDYWYPYQQKFGVSFNDVSDVNNIQSLGQLTIDGYVLSSRRIGDKLYLVSTYAPQLTYDSWPETEEAQQALYNELVQDDSLQLFPKVYQGDASSPLVSPANCYLPQGAEETQGHASVVTLTTFDLNSPEQFESVCVLSAVDGFYASDKAIYFYGTNYELTGGQEGDDGISDESQEQTVIHKFSYLNDSVSYSATGKVNGRTGWRNSHLRFSERGGYLRLVTSKWGTSGGPEHTFYVLSENQQELEVVAHLPNDNRPEKIGKPGEDVYAVRYFNDKAYIVTFERIDPLYVLDLTDVFDPKVAGELEVPGYSAYLQPINDDYVLGIGQQIDPNTNGNNIVEGAKVELYDVSDMGNPQVVSTLVFAQGYTPVEWDYHALTQLKVNDEQVKMALPVYSWLRQEVEPNVWQWQRQNSMELLDINLGSSNTGIESIGTLTVKDEHYGNWGDRAILHGDIVYYVRHNSVWQSYWSTPSILNGPY